MHAQVPGLCRFILFGLRSHSHPAEARSAYCTASMSALAARLAVALRPTLYTIGNEVSFRPARTQAPFFWSDGCEVGCAHRQQHRDDVTAAQTRVAQHSHRLANTVFAPFLPLRSFSTVCFRRRDYSRAILNVYFHLPNIFTFGLCPLSPLCCYFVLFFHENTRKLHCISPLLLCFQDYFYYY